MNSRQVELFKNIIQEYLLSAKAVGSKFLVDKYSLDVSPATIRNDMVELERQNLISHPHTSAGRIPTEKGYEYYINNYLREKAVASKDKSALDSIKSQIQEPDIITKDIAKKIAELTGSAAIVAFSKNNIFYTGLSNLFSQPEFSDINVVYSISEVVDRMDEVIDNIFDDISDTQIKIGRNNCFSGNCSSILTKSGKKLFGILGPMRMDYERNLSLINYSKKLI
ncbi:MAG: DeoR family transcriptional regulator [Candidatus Kuenenbacteria bacterium]